MERQSVGPVYRLGGPVHPAAPVADELDYPREHGEEKDGKNDQAEVVLHRWDVAEEVAREYEKTDPEDAAEDVVGQKFPVPHCADTGHERGDCTVDRHE